MSIGKQAICLPWHAVLKYEQTDKLKIFNLIIFTNSLNFLPRPLNLKSFVFPSLVFSYYCIHSPPDIIAITKNLASLYRKINLTLMPSDYASYYAPASQTDFTVEGTRR